MDIDRLQVVLRKRSTLEAIDLGLTLHQRWRGPVLRAWCTTVVPAWMAILGLTTLVGIPKLGVFLIWWCMPLWDKVPLFVISRAIFGATPTQRDVWAALPKLWKRNVFADLLLYRLSLMRTFLLPVGELEESSGSQLRTRRGTLARGAEGMGAIGLHLAALIVMPSALLAFLLMLIMTLPEMPDFSADVFWQALVGEGPTWVRWATVAIWLFTMTAIEPVVVTSGFALYLTRRTAVEGWDVALGFRRLASRLAHRSRIAGTFVAMALALGASTSSLAESRDENVQWNLLTEADQPAPIDLAYVPRAFDFVDVDAYVDHQPGPTPETAETTERAAATVFQRKEFGYSETYTTWERKEIPSLGGIEFPFLRTWADWFDGIPFWQWLRELFADDTPAAPAPEFSIGDHLATAAKVLIWIALGVTAILIGVGFWRRRRAGIGLARRARLAAPLQMEDGVLLAPSPVRAPDPTVPDQVWALWKHGETDAAMALLYNSALSRLVTESAIEIEEAWTEGDCERAVRAHVGGPAAAYFTRIARARQRIAYAHRSLTDPDMRRLCDDWIQLGRRP